MNRSQSSKLSSVSERPTWKLLKLLGQGHCSSVYLAHRAYPSQPHTPSGQCVLKIVSKEEVLKKQKLQRVKAEYDILSIQKYERHPCLVQVLSASQTPKLLIYELEYYTFGAFFRCILSRLPMHRLPSENITRFVASELILALEFLHDRGVIHRDVKPENLLVGANGHIALTDFDLAFVEKKDDEIASVSPPPQQDIAVAPLLSSYRSSAPVMAHGSEGISDAAAPSRRPFAKLRARVPMGNSPSDALLSQPKPLSNQDEATALATGKPHHHRTHSLVGTVEYMAPEVIADERQSGAVDTWALGVLLYECTYGITPFRGNDERDTMQKIALHESVPFPASPKVSPELRDLITQLLHIVPEKRIGHMKDKFAILRHHPWLRDVNFVTLLDEPSPLLDILTSHPEEGAATSPQARPSTDEFLRAASDSLVHEVALPLLQDNEFEFFVTFIAESVPPVREASELRQILSLPGCGNTRKVSPKEEPDRSFTSEEAVCCPRLPRLWQLPWSQWTENLKSAVYLSDPKR